MTAIDKLAAELMNLPEAEWQRLAQVRLELQQIDAAAVPAEGDTDSPKVGPGETADGVTKD